MDEILKECYEMAVSNALSTEEFVLITKEKMYEHSVMNGCNPDTIVSDIWDIPEDLLKQNTRAREILEPRQVVMWLRRKNTKEPLMTIGKRYGRDHTTVMHAVKTVNNLMETDKEFRRKVELAQKRIDHERKMQMRKDNLEASKLDNNAEAMSELSITGSHSESEQSQINDLPKNE